MNEWLFDMFDGQVYIAKFVVYAPSNILERDRGISNIYLPEDQCSTCNPHAIGLGTPYRPGYFFTPLPRTDSGMAYEAVTMTHEFLHAWVGVADEYRTEDGTDARCPESFSFDGPCIMSHYDYFSMHLCRPDTHNENTWQHQLSGMSCYELAKKNLAESYVGDITIPDEYIRGPKDVPKAEIVFKLESNGARFVAPTCDSCRN
jgi:hypothetical protein